MVDYGLLWQSTVYCGRIQFIMVEYGVYYGIVWFIMIKCGLLC